MQGFSLAWWPSCDVLPLKEPGRQLLRYAKAYEAGWKSSTSPLLWQSAARAVPLTKGGSRITSYDTWFNATDKDCITSPYRHKKTLCTQHPVSCTGTASNSSAAAHTKRCWSLRCSQVNASRARFRRRSMKATSRLSRPPRGGEHGFRKESSPRRCCKLRMSASTSFLRLDLEAGNHVHLFQCIQGSGCRHV